MLAAFSAFIMCSFAETSKELGEDMITVMKVKERYLKAMDSVLSTQIKSLKTKNDLLLNKIIKEFKDGSLSWESFKPELVKIYTDSFSNTELKEICSFYKTKIGQQMVNDPKGFQQKIKKPGFEKEFSESDRQALEKFNSTGLAQKAIEKKTEIQQKIKQLAMERMMKIIRQLQQESIQNGRLPKTK